MKVARCYVMSKKTVQDGSVMTCIVVCDSVRLLFYTKRSGK